MMWGNAELATSELAEALMRLRDHTRFSDVENELFYQASIRLRKDVQAFDTAVLLEALDERSMWINPETFDVAADEIDCCGGAHRCESCWYEDDTNASGCEASERGDYCPNDVAETLRAVAKCARAAKARPEAEGTKAAGLAQSSNEQTDKAEGSTP